jgi:hypothetical protein
MKIWRKLSGIVLLVLLLSSANAGDSLTAPELARHLGVYWWKIPKESLPSYYSPKIYKVQDGKITLPQHEYLGVGFKNNGDLTVCFRKTDKGIALSLDDDAMAVNTDLPNLTQTGAVILRDNVISQNPAEPQILCYNRAKEGAISKAAGWSPRPKTYQDITEGYVLVILPDNKQFDFDK